MPQGAAYGVTHDAFCTCRAEFARAPDKLAHVSEAMEFMFKFEALCRPFVDQIVTSYTNPSPISKDALRDLARAHHPAGGRGAAFRRRGNVKRRNARRRRATGEEQARVRRAAGVRRGGGGGQPAALDGVPGAQRDRAHAPPFCVTR